MNLSKEISNGFNRYAHSYEQVAIIQHEIGNRLFERLDYLKIEPKHILDLGCGTGIFSEMLKKKYPNALIIGLDLAFSMLVQSQKKQSWLKHWPLVNAHMDALPFENSLFDLVFANQVIHWAHSLPRALRELNRIIAKDGCFMFSTLGPDSFKELKIAFSKASPSAHVNDFLDMHVVGDNLLQEKFLDPVVDMEPITVQYGNINKLLLSLKRQGVRNINPLRTRGLMGKGHWQAFKGAYEALKTAEGKYPLTYEAVYGHAWKGHEPGSGVLGETWIPVTEIRRTRGEKL